MKRLKMPMNPIQILVLFAYLCSSALSGQTTNATPPLPDAPQAVLVGSRTTGNDAVAAGDRAFFQLRKRRQHLPVSVRA